MRSMGCFSSLKSFLLVTVLLASLALPGCTSPLGPPDPTATLSVDIDQINVGEAVNFDARDSTSPDATIITQYSWDFGDGSDATTTQGLTHHVFSTPGSFDVVVTVTNDQGGTDTARWTINVNSLPVCDVLYPAFAKVGETIILDGSGSYDPEGGVLAYSWDLDYNSDSDEDGDPRNDVDSTSDSMEILINESGVIEGALTVTDDKGAEHKAAFAVNVSTKTWKVTWERVRITEEWSGNLEQGKSWTITHIPGVDGRLIDVNATLTLEMDMLIHEMPQDNFTLKLAVPSSGWDAEEKTRQENVTKPPTAYIDRSGMNPIPPEEKTYKADHEDDLMAYVLEDSQASFGRGNWTWQVTADQADPDFLVDGIDPDPGNDWTLVIEFILLEPRIQEVFE